MDGLEELPADALRRRCDPEALGFETTAELPDLEQVIAQDRAVEALQLGMDVEHRGYNIFVVGPAGTGRHTVVMDFLARKAAEEPVPPDWCYVHDFAQPNRPRAFELPAGRGNELRADMDRFLREVREAIPAAFASDEYRAQREQLEEEIKRIHHNALEELEAYAKGQRVGIAQTPVGFAVAAMRGDEPMSKDEAEKLSPEDKARLEARMTEVRRRLETTMEMLAHAQKKHRERVRELDQRTTKGAVHAGLEEVRRRYEDLPKVVGWLDAVEKDLVEHVGELFRKDTEDGPEGELLSIDREPSPTRRFRVNVVVDNSQQKGAPLVLEDHPIVPNLIGRIEHVSRLGTMTTDFTLIRPGALHRANGGYLVLDARRLVTQAWAWDELKRCLRAGVIRIESLGEMLGLVSSFSLEPEPIPLDVKVVLIGERWLFHLLSAHDPDLREHFKVQADFDDDMPRDAVDQSAYVRLVATMARKKNVLPLHREAVARVIEEASRWADDQQKISSNVRALADLMVEADHYARADGAEVIGREHVQRAVDATERRAGRPHDKLLEALGERLLLVDAEGERVGQVNALAVVGLGDHHFGYPTRVTARIRIGHGELVDIEREVQLGGPIHSKGVLILAGFLGGRYGRERPLSLAASLVFEQSYGMIEGDSASLAELCALLSALSDVPIRQSFALTGSVDQMGRVQAVGGINEKVEGWFDACRALGSSGEHGVLIPAATVRHLRLRDAVVVAVREGRFHVWPVQTVDQAITLLTGTDAGEPRPDGRWDDLSLNGRVASRLARFSRASRPVIGSSD